jgi:hypothetical protein
VVLKPAEQSPLSALAFAELVVEAGIPEGVINVITGFGEDAGAALVAHPLVRGVTFTGSVATGREVYKNAAAGIKPVVLELGGKRRCRRRNLRKQRPGLLGLLPPVPPRGHQGAVLGAVPGQGGETDPGPRSR